MERPKIVHVRCCANSLYIKYSTFIGGEREIYFIIIGNAFEVIFLTFSVES